MIHNIVKKALWPRKVKRKRAPRNRMHQFAGLYDTLKAMPEGDTIAVEMLDGPSADKGIHSIRNLMIQYRSDLGYRFRTKTETDDTTKTLYIQKRYGVFN